MEAEFEEFVPCSQVKDSPRFIDVNQTENYYRDIALPDSRKPFADLTDED